MREDGGDMVWKKQGPVRVPPGPGLRGIQEENQALQGRAARNTASSRASQGSVRERGGWGMMKGTVGIC